jgi:hypothetical protein
VTNFLNSNRQIDRSTTKLPAHLFKPESSLFQSHILVKKVTTMVVPETKVLAIASHVCPSMRSLLSAR